MIGIKICGINDPATLDTVIELSVDWVGYVFFPPSPRYVTPEAAAGLAGRRRSGPPRVGLFVDPTEAMIADVLGVMKLDILQIYGAQDRLPAIKARFGIPVWRAAGITGVMDLPADSSGADRLVLEAKAPIGSTRPGGNAAMFDWSVLRGWTAPGPWILAGGLTPDNVAAAIQATAADAVDVSSGVECSKGVKDAALIRAFVAAARAAG